MEVQKKMTMSWGGRSVGDVTGLVQTCFQPRSGDGSGLLRRPGPERRPTSNALAHRPPRVLRWCFFTWAGFRWQFWCRPGPVLCQPRHQRVTIHRAPSYGCRLLIRSSPMERISWQPDPSCAVVVAPRHMNFWTVRMFRIELYILYRVLGVHNMCALFV